jgi:hypothetical protein
LDRILDFHHLEATMRMMLKFTVPVEKGNAALKDGSLGKAMESIMGQLKPEAAYSKLCAGLPITVWSSARLSLASAARGSDLQDMTTARILEKLVAGYQAGAALSKDFGGPTP